MHYPTCHSKYTYSTRTFKKKLYQLITRRTNFFFFLPLQVSVTTAFFLDDYVSTYRSYSFLGAIYSPFTTTLLNPRTFYIFTSQILFASKQKFLRSFYKVLVYLLLEVAHLFPFSKLRRKIKFENKYASAVIRLLSRLLVRETSNVLNRLTLPQMSSIRLASYLPTLSRYFILYYISMQFYQIC